MASQGLKSRTFRACYAVSLVLTASISVVFSGSFNHSLSWWIVFSVFLALLSVVGYFAAGYDGQKLAVQQLHCELIPPTIFQVANITSLMAETIEQCEEVAQDLRSSVDKPKFPIESLKSLLGSLYETDSRTPGEFLSSVENWLIETTSNSRWIDARVRWWTKELTGIGLKLELKNSSLAPLSDLDINVQFPEGTKVWAPEEIDDEEPILPTPPRRFGMQNRFTVNFPQVFAFDSLGVSSLRSSYDQVRISSDRNAISFQVRELRPEQLIALPTVHLAVLSPDSLISVEWTVTAMNQHGVSKKSETWSVEVVI